jgi:hypothetical protein
MRFVQHIKAIKAIILLENVGQRNFQEENKKKLRICKKNPALWTRASEPGLLNQIFDSVSVIWSFLNIIKKYFL